MTVEMSEILHQFHFLRPAWFLALLPVALLVAALWWRRFRQAGLERICDPELLPHLLLDQGNASTRRPLFLLGAAWLLAVTALAGPVWRRQPEPVYRLKSGRVLVLDLSPSMAATDITPSRVERARYKIRDILKRSREGRTGLVVFSGDPHVVVPLTSDVATIASMLPALTVDIMPAYGNDAAPALDLAATLLKRGRVRGGDILLITDGIDDMASTMAKASQLRKKGIHLSVLGIGSQSGAPIPDPSGSGFLTKANGAPQMSRLNVPALRELAAAGGGRYSSLTADDRDINSLLVDHSRHELNAGQALNRQVKRWQEEGAWLVLPILLLALAGFRRGWLAALILLLVWRPAPARAMSWQDLWQRPDQQAAELLAEGQAQKAAALFTDPDWRAVAQHRAGDYQAAIKTGRHTTDATGLYNLGNSLARAGRLKEALAAYEKSLKLDPDDPDARHNRKLIEKLLAQRRKQQKKKKGKQQKKGSGAGSNHKQQGGKKKEGQQNGRKKEGRPGQPRAGQNRERQPQGMKNKGAGKQKQQEVRAEQGKESRRSQGTKGSSRQQAVPKKPQQGQQQKESRLARDLGRSRKGAEHKGRRQPAATEASPPNSSSSKKRHKVQPVKNLMLEQWLRQVPDDPAGLLRRKFMLEHQRRLHQEGLQ